jgi:hypothetical protein
MLGLQYIECPQSIQHREEQRFFSNVLAQLPGKKVFFS